jgi:dTDP-L-rhamnose 4-epimerase
VLDNLAPDVHPARPDYLNAAARYVIGDVSDPAAWESALEGVDALCHQAARVGLGVDFGDVRRYVADNDVGTAVGLGALHDCGFTGRIVLASSMVVYGEGRYRCATHGPCAAPPRLARDLEAGAFEPRCQTCGAALARVLVDEDAPLDPRNVYAATKLHQEHLCAAFAREHPVTCTSLRYHNVYGSRMPADTPYAGVASIFRSAVERGESPTVLEDGGQTRDFVHVSDVARANVLALSVSEPVGAALNVASGEPHTVLDLATAVASDSGFSPVVTGGFRLGDVRHVVGSPERAADLLGFRAQTSFSVGMAAFVGDRLR